MGNKENEKQKKFIARLNDTSTTLLVVAILTLVVGVLYFLFVSMTGAIFFAVAALYAVFSYFMLRGYDFDGKLTKSDKRKLRWIAVPGILINLILFRGIIPIFTAIMYLRVFRYTIEFKTVPETSSADEEYDDCDDDDDDRGDNEDDSEDEEGYDDELL